MEKKKSIKEEKYDIVKKFQDSWRERRKTYYPEEKPRPPTPTTHPRPETK